MSEIKLITKEDFNLLKYTKLNWDVEVNGTPYQIIKVDSFVHTIGGHLDWGSGNDFWAYPLEEEISFDNLIEFNGEPGPCWGIEYSPLNSIKCKFGEVEVRRGRKLIITRNNKPFYDGFMTLNQAIAYVKDGILDEHPMNLNERNFDKKCIGRKIWYRSQPATITSYIQGQACIIINPDGMDKFSIPPEFENNIIFSEYEGRDIKTSIFDEHIYWFRDI